jgi:hypothetical protein
MMKKTLSLFVLVSLSATVAMAAPQGANEWLEDQATAQANAEASGIDCLDAFEYGVTKMAYFDNAREAILENAVGYKFYTEAAIRNLKTGKSNAAIYSKFSNSLKFHEAQWYGKPLVNCLKPYLNFQDYAREESQVRADKNINQATKIARLGQIRQVQLNLANRVLVKINNIQKAVR